MLSTAKKMACSTLSTYVFDFPGLNTTFLATLYLQDPAQTSQDLVKAHESSQPSSTVGKETMYHIIYEHSSIFSPLLLVFHHCIHETLSRSPVAVADAHRPRAQKFSFLVGILSQGIIERQTWFWYQRAPPTCHVYANKRGGVSLSFSIFILTRDMSNKIESTTFTFGRFSSIECIVEVPPSTVL